MLRKKQKGFSLIELLVVVAIIGILAAVGVVAYNGYTKHAKVAAVKANHKTIVQMIGAKAQMCNIGNAVDYLHVKNNEPLITEKSSFSCSPSISIDDFIEKMNEHVYGMNWRSPYYGENFPWLGGCQINVTNCGTGGAGGRGYIGDKESCPSHWQQQGYIAISKTGSNKIKVCSHLKREGGVNEYMEHEIAFE